MRQQQTIVSTQNRINIPRPNQISRVSGNRSVSISHNYNSNQNRTQGSIAKNIPKQNSKFTFYLGKGNNELLVKNVLQSRGCWIESADSTSTFVNFKWQQDQKGFKYNRLVDNGMYRACLNQFQFHQCLSNKQFLFRNIQAYCQKNGEDIWSIVPPTFILNIQDYNNMQYLKQFIQFYIKNYPARQKNIHPDYQKQIYEHRKKLKQFFFNSNEKRKITIKMPKMNSCYLSDNEGDYLWIMKPTFLNRGRGIQIFSNLNTLIKLIAQNVAGYIERGPGSIKQQPSKNNIDYIKRNSDMVRFIGKMDQEQLRQKKKVYIETKQTNTSFDGNQYIRVIPKVPALIKTDCFLIQKYMEKPLLIKNHKFDIRMWVLVTHNLNVFLFKQGYIRLSSSQYNCKYIEDNASVHLTNNAVQKFTSQYGKISEGNQMSFSNLKQVMIQNGLSFEDCYKIIEKHVQVSMAATISKLNVLNRKYTFQIFGYDFMIDCQGYPWLIEVNNNPCIEESSTLLSKLLPRMLDDAFKLTLDTIFWGSTYTKKYPIPGYPDNENLWKNIPILKPN